MNKLYKLVFTLLLLFLNSCNTKINKYKNSNLTIENFNMIHFKKSGNKLYNIKSPYSFYNQLDQSYSLQKTNIKFYDDEKIKYLVSSENAKLYNANNIIKLTGKVEIIDIDNDKTTINSDSLYWNIDKSEFILEGEVILINNTINLQSSKAKLNQLTNIIEFFKPVKYNYNDKSNVTKYDISSENAYYDIKNKNVIFRSEENSVKSKIVF